MAEIKELKAIVVDDEPHGVKMLVNFLHNYCENVSVVATASNAQEARQILQTITPHVLFLDINMPSENGFDLVASLQQRPFAIVFITAYQEYAIKAIKAGAMDYLLKPVDIDELRDCVEKLRQHSNNNTNSEKQVGVVLQSLSTTNAELKRIAVPTTEGFEFLQLDSIVRCESDNTYTTFYLNDGKKVLVCKPIKEYEELLSSSGFMRVHRSHLVNLRMVKHVHRTDGWHLITSDNTRVEIARRRVDEVLSTLNIH